MGLDPATRAADRLLIGRLAGLLFLAGSIAAVPVDQLLRPAVGTASQVLTLVGIASGVLCMLVPWDRIRRGWQHLIPFVGSVEIAVKMVTVGEHAHLYLWFLVFVAVYAALAFEDRRDIGAHVGLAIAVAAVPLALADPADRANRLAEALIALPILVAATAAVVHLRERLVAAAGQLAEEARIDPLTGVGNFRLLEERLRYELTRHRRNGQSLALLVFDLDNFKQVNDTLGHPVGDRLLRQVGQVLLETVRDQDTVVRQGGDEFAVLAPETSAEEAEGLVARIKDEVRGLCAVEVPVSASGGFAVFPDDALTVEVLQAQADLKQREDKTASRSPAVAAR